MKLENTIGQLQQIWLRVFGIWPNTSYPFLRRLFWTIAIIIQQIFQYRYIIMHFQYIEFPEVMDLLSIILSYFLLIIRLFVFWYKQRTFSRILTMMAIDWKECSAAEFSVSAMIYNAKLSQRCTNSILALYMIGMLFYSSNIFMNHADVQDVRAFNVSARPLILHMDLPFDVNKKFVYELVIIVQFFHLFVCGIEICTLNVLLINLVLHVGGQIDILRQWLMEIFLKERKYTPSFNMIRRIIKKHQRIILFSKYIEDLYSSIAMVIFVSDTLIICSLGFILVTSLESPNAFKIIMKVLIFYFNINIEVFLFCFAGEYLTAKSTSIGDAAYNSFWYETNSKNSRIILFLITRSQDEMAITIGKMMNLSLERFNGIVKASASYVSVLLAMN